MKRGILFIALVILIGTMIGCSKPSAESKIDSALEKTKNIEAKWEVSPLFNAGQYSMIGEEGRLGFIYDDSEPARFYPNKTQKYMWHFWGTDQELGGNLKVIATHEHEKASIVVTEGGLGGENNGADRHAPSNMSLPKSGKWKLDAYIGENLFGTVFVEVHESN